jgi:hypothetical protein
MIRFILVPAMLLASSTLGAQEINRQARLGEAVRQGCTVQQVHTPAGKMVHNAPIVTCPERQTAKLSQGSQLALQQAPSTSARR